jgi:hypothetical protein
VISFFPHGRFLLEPEKSVTSFDPFYEAKEAHRLAHLAMTPHERIALEENEGLREVE